MYYKIFINMVAIILVALLDAVVVGLLPTGFHQLHLFPLALVFVVLLGNVRVAAWWALGGALILELFSFRFFGLYLILFWLILALIHFLFQKVMTNRSIFSIAVIVAAVTLLCDIVLLSLDYRSGLVSISFSAGLISILISLVSNVIMAIIIFYVSNIVTRRLRPVFLSTRS